MYSGEILKKFRINRNMTQSEVSKGIISRQAYSKIEKGQSEPSFQIFSNLLERLNYDLSDFMNEKRNLFSEKQYYKIYLQALDGTLTENEVEQLYKFSYDHRKENSNLLALYGKIKGHIHHRYPLIVPNFSREDKQLFKDYILNLNGHYSLNDLLIIGDFATISIHPDELGDFYDTLPSFKTSDYEYDISSYQLQICKIYNNFSDVFLPHNDLKRAEDCIKKLENFLKQKLNLRYAFYLKINKICLEYKKSDNPKILLELLDIAKIMESVGDTETANAIRYQYETYVNETPYVPENALTSDK